MLSIDPDSGIRADQVVELDLGLLPSPSGSGELLLQNVNGNAYLVLVVVDRDYREVGPAVVTFTRCEQSVFGYPNDEAQGGDPRLRDHWGFLEVRDSSWPRRLERYNRQAFPVPGNPWSARHFVVMCKENLGEFLADDVSVEAWPGTFDAAVAEAVRRSLQDNPA